MSVNDVVSLKKKGKIALNSGDYSEAYKYYTEALNQYDKHLKPDIYRDDGIEVDNIDSHQESSIYSKRSVVLLKLQQFYFAYEDAKQVTDISPEWFKGYLRKANIEFECSLFENALKNYQLALRYLCREENEEFRNRYEKYINQTVNHLLFVMQRERGLDYQIPWIGAAFGLVVGMAVVTWDFVSHPSYSYISHPILKLTVIGLVSFIFFYLANLQRYFNRKSKEQYLKPPYRTS